MQTPVYKRSFTKLYIETKLTRLIVLRILYLKLNIEIVNVLNHLPNNARIWLYTAPRPLTVEEHEFISARLENFITEWAAHGAKLNAAFEIVHNRFILIAVDEGAQNATGCSIDSCVHELQRIGQELSLDFFDRTLVVYRDEDNNLVASCKMNEVKQMVADGDFTPSTNVFDTTLQTLGNFRTKFETEAKHTWMNRFFNTITAWKNWPF